MSGGPKYWRSKNKEVKLIRIRTNGTVYLKKYNINLSSKISDKNNPLLQNGDTLLVGRTNFAKSSDLLEAISKPFSSIETILEVFD